VSRGRTPVPDNVVTAAQMRVLREIEANPGARLKDWAAALGVSTTAIFQHVYRLGRAGWLRPVEQGKRSTRWVLTEKCGCCPTCRRAMISGAVRVVDGLRWKLDEDAMRAIAMSPGKASALAKRFQCDPSHIRRIKAKAVRS